MLQTAVLPEPENKRMSILKYVLITPARNEANCIENTILSVIAQRLAPYRWIIVDDGSSDNMSAIIKRYQQQHSWITLVTLRSSRSRNFASKIHAFNGGLRMLRDERYGLIGNLDADIILGPDYYANMVAEFERNPALGLAGGAVYVPVGSRYSKHDTTWDSVAGAIQLFRRECFEEIGGYLPIESGGVDAAAEIMARMRGWSVYKVENNAVYEQRRTGHAHGRPWRAAYKEGVHYHRLGYNLLFYCLRCVYRISDPPIVVGSVSGIIGFLYARMRRDRIALPSDVVSYLHSEQLSKIRRCIQESRIYRLRSSVNSRSDRAQRVEE
jgi:poly-beta-1,6-N-acetyl-D-glucosamine synthase